MPSVAKVARRKGSCETLALLIGESVLCSIGDWTTLPIGQSRGPGFTLDLRNAKPRTAELSQERRDRTEAWMEMLEISPTAQP